MTRKNEHLHPFAGRVSARDDKERRLRQRAKVIWFTGLSGAGKTTLARKLEDELSRKGYLVQLLDGDNVRTGINNNLGFSDEDRIENIRRIAEVSKLFLHCGIITINAFISPTEQIRQMATEIIGKDDFLVIFVNAPIEVCERRDVKGLYAKARRGEILDFTGITSPFENPGNADLEIKTDLMNVEESFVKLLEFVLPKIEYVSK